MSRQAVQKYGAATFSKLNKGQVPAFAEGGLVTNGDYGSTPMDSGSTASNNISITVNVNESGSVTSSPSESFNTNGAMKEDAHKLAKTIENTVVKVILDQKRQGGMLHRNS